MIGLRVNHFFFLEKINQLYDNRSTAHLRGLSGLFELLVFLPPFFVENRWLRNLKLCRFLFLEVQVTFLGVLWFHFF